MEQEPSNELMGMEGHFSDFIVSLPIPIREGDFALINREDAIICYGHSVGITTEIFKNLHWTIKGWLCIGNPFGLKKRG